MPIKVTARITGNALNGFPRSLKQLSEQGRINLTAAAFATAQDVATEARRRVRVSVVGPESRKAKTRPGPGELRDTIRAEPSASTAPVAYVKAGMGKLRRRSRATTAKGQKRAARRKPTAANKALGVYAMAVEYGAPHRGVASRPFLRPAIHAKRNVLVARAAEALRAAAVSAGGS